MQPLPAIDTNAHRHRNTMPPSVPLPLPLAPPIERLSPPTEPTRPPLDSCSTGLADRSAPPPHPLHHPPLPLPPTERPSPSTEPTRPPLDSCYTGLADRSAPPPRHLHQPYEETPPPLTGLTRQRSRSLSQSPSKRVRHRTSGTFYPMCYSVYRDVVASLCHH